MFGGNHSRDYQNLLRWTKVMDFIFEKAVDIYDQLVGAEVYLLDEQGKKITTRVDNSVKDNKGNPRGIEHSTLYVYH